MKPIYMRSSQVSRPHSERVRSCVDTAIFSTMFNCTCNNAFRYLGACPFLLCSDLHRFFLRSFSRGFSWSHRSYPGSCWDLNGSWWDNPFTLPVIVNSTCNKIINILINWFNVSGITVFIKTNILFAPGSYIFHTATWGLSSHGC